MFGHHREGHTHSVSMPKSLKQTNNEEGEGFEFPEDHEQALYNIWQTYKKTKYVSVPLAISEERNRAVLLMMQCHKIMKLPIETLFLATSVFDKVLNTNYQLSEMKFRVELNLNVLGISCLYSCQKLEKIRNYGVSHWLKHLSSQNLLSLGYTNIILTSESLKKYEAYIMEAMCYNLFSSTSLDILLGIWTLRPPNQKQFYFCQYLLELSLFCQINLAKKYSQFNANTAESLNEMAQNQIEMRQNMLSIDIAIAIANLGWFFFGKEEYNGEFLIRKIWGQLIDQDRHKEFQIKKRIIKNISNELFQKVLSCQCDPYCKRVLQKYRKQTNFSVSTLKFVNLAQVNFMNHISQKSHNSQQNSQKIQQCGRKFQISNYQRINDLSFRSI